MKLQFLSKNFFFQSFKTQYEQLNRSLLEGKEKHDQEIKDANKRIRELEQRSVRVYLKRETKYRT